MSTDAARIGSRSSRKNAAAAAKQRREKILLAVCGVIFVGLLAFEGPKTFKQLSGSSSSAPTPAPAVQAAPAAQAAGGRAGRHPGSARRAPPAVRGQGSVRRPGERRQLHRSRPRLRAGAERAHLALRRQGSVRAAGDALERPRSDPCASAPGKGTGTKAAGGSAGTSCWSPPSGSPTVIAPRRRRRGSLARAVSVASRSSTRRSTGRCAPGSGRSSRAPTLRSRRRRTLSPPYARAGTPAPTCGSSVAERTDAPHG